VAVDILTPLLGVLHAASFLELKWDGRVSAGDALVGAGTLLLAGTTAWLARRTRQDVERNSEGVEIAARGLEMHDWPFLVATPDRPTFVFSGVYDRDTGEPNGDPEWRCDVNVANHGRGPAIFDGVSLKDEGDRELVGTDWEVESIHLPGEEELFGVGLGTNEPPKVDSGILTLRLLYRSATGIRYETSHRLQVASADRAIRLDFKQSKA
jgi:hypothetical protein